MESFRRDLSNDMAEHKPILKNSQNTFYPRFSFTPITDIALPKTGVLFLLCLQIFPDRHISINRESAWSSMGRFSETLGRPKYKRIVCLSSAEFAFVRAGREGVRA